MPSATMGEKTKKPEKTKVKSVGEEETRKSKRMRKT